MKSVSFNLNGTPRQVQVPPERTLLDVLRETFKVKSVKDACSPQRDRNYGAGAKQLFQHLSILPGIDALRAMALDFDAGLGAGCDSRQDANMLAKGWQWGATKGRALARGQIAG